jgi:uncharacterized membrane protein HdeD (DUF308 family)
MNKKLLLYGFLVVIGLADAILNLWVFLLEHETMPLLQAAVGVLIMIAGIIQFQRERSAARKNGT